LKQEYKFDLRLSILQANFTPATIFMPKYLISDDHGMELPSAIIGTHSE